MIHVIATITAKPGKRAELLAEFNRNVPAVRAEDGCIEYRPTVDVASGLMVQGPLRDDVILVIEKWASLEALKAHTQAPHMAEYRVRVKEKDLVQGVTLEVTQDA